MPWRPRRCWVRSGSKAIATAAKAVQNGLHFLPCDLRSRKAIATAAKAVQNAHQCNVFVDRRKKAIATAAKAVQNARVHSVGKVIYGKAIATAAKAVQNDLGGDGTGQARRKAIATAAKAVQKFEYHGAVKSFTLHCNSHCREGSSERRAVIFYGRSHVCGDRNSHCREGRSEVPRRPSLRSSANIAIATAARAVPTFRNPHPISYT